METTEAGGFFGETPQLSPSGTTFRAPPKRSKLVEENLSGEHLDINNPRYTDTQRAIHRDIEGPIPKPPKLQAPRGQVDVSTYLQPPSQAQVAAGGRWLNDRAINIAKMYYAALPKDVKDRDKEQRRNITYAYRIRGRIPPRNSAWTDMVEAAWEDIKRTQWYPQVVKNPKAPGQKTEKWTEGFEDQDLIAIKRAQGLIRQYKKVYKRALNKKDFLTKETNKLKRQKAAYQQKSQAIQAENLQKFRNMLVQKYGNDTAKIEEAYGKRLAAIQQAQESRERRVTQEKALFGQRHQLGGKPVYYRRPDGQVWTDDIRGKTAYMALVAHRGAGEIVQGPRRGNPLGAVAKRAKQIKDTTGLDFKSAQQQAWAEYRADRDKVLEDIPSKPYPYTNLREYRGEPYGLLPKLTRITPYPDNRRVGPIRVRLPAAGSQSDRASFFRSMYQQPTPSNLYGTLRPTNPRDVLGNLY